MPQVVERVEPFGILADPLVERLYERTAQFDGVGQEFVAEFVAEAEVVFGGHVLRMRRARDDEAVPADDLLRFGIPDAEGETPTTT